ncbi:MAG: hypothetical protein IPO27_07905 [Bacteroidetes bacterium]|nr:hypothetical protein [Bacteroidota bacterium]
MVNKIKLLILDFIIAGLGSCKKETNVVYEVNESTVNTFGNPKERIKTTVEFISIAYQDLFGNTISAQKLSSLSVAYTAFGDKKLIEDMIIKNFINQPNTTIPTQAVMMADKQKFISETFKKIYNRNPGEYETWFMEKEITDNASLTPKMIYYAMMTSDEYRYY